MPARSSGVWQVSERQLSSLRAMRHDDARETWCSCFLVTRGCWVLGWRQCLLMCLLVLGNTVKGFWVMVRVKVGLRLSL